MFISSSFAANTAASSASGFGKFYAAIAAPAPSSSSAAPATTDGVSSGTVVISQAALDALAAEGVTNQVEARLAKIDAKTPVSRTADDLAYIQANNPKLAAKEAPGSTLNQKSSPVS